MFGISAGELLIILVVAALVLGPKNIAQALNALKTGLGKFREWSGRLREQSTVDISTFGISQQDLAAIRDFNPAQFDPRRIIQEAVQEEMQAWITATSGVDQVAKSAASSVVQRSPSGGQRPRINPPSAPVVSETTSTTEIKKDTELKQDMFTLHDYLNNQKQGDQS